MTALRSLDFPGLVFLQAQGYTVGRPDGPPLWIVWHDMEVDELPTKAETTAGYFANPTDGRDVSSHYTVDNNSAVQCVRETDVAWTVGNQPGNNRGINIELAGRAAQTRAQWLDPYGLAMFNVVAPIVARSMTRWRIPNRWCSIADLKAYRPGHTTHNDLRVAFGATTHTDPGAGFPRDHLLAVVEAALKGAPVTTANDPTGRDWELLRWRIDAILFDSPVIRGGPEKGTAVTSVLARRADAAAVQALTGKVGDAAEAGALAGVAAGADALAAAVIARLPEGALSKEDVEAAVKAAFAGGLAP